jgi:O-antigen/teichoic acid export membrane protein
VTEPSRHDLTRGWLRNVGSGYADTIVGGLVFLVLTPILVHRLGTAAYALWVLGHTITFYLAFLDIGLGNAQVRYHARFAAQGRTAQMLTTLATSCTSLVIAGVVAGLIGTGIAFGVPASWLHISPSLVGEFRLVVLLLAVQMLVSFSGAAVDNLYEWASRFDLRNARSIVMRVLTAAAEVIALYAGAGLVEVVAIELVATCVKLLLDLIITARLLPGWWRGKPQFRGALWHRLRSFALWTSADEVATEGGAQLDHILIVALFPLALLTPYSLCTGVAGLLLMAVEPIVQTFFPLASGMHARRRDADLSQLLLMGSKVATVVAAPFAVVLAFFGHRALELWVPEAAPEVPPGLMPLVVMDYMTSMYLWTATVILVAIGRTRLAVMLTVSELVVGVVLMYLLSPHFGLAGLALASLIANVVLGMGFQIPVAARAVGIPLATFIGSTLGRVAIAAAPAVIAAVTLRPVVEEGGWAMLIGASLATAAVFGVSLLLFGTRRDERALYLSFLKR